MDLQLQGRTALVTGASSGIGVAIALSLAREGVRLAIAGRNRERLHRTADAIAAAGSPAPLLLLADLTERAALDQLAEAALAALGRIDILVNNAGGSRPLGPDAGDAQWEEGFALKFHAGRILTELMLPGMRAAGWGRVINVTGAMVGKALNAAAPAIAATHSWAKALATTVAPHGITVNSVAPGRIISDQIMTRLHPTEESRQQFIRENIPIGYFGEAQDFAPVVTFLASPLARYVTGIVIPIDGGLHRLSF